MVSVNECAMEVVETLLDYVDELNIDVRELRNGATVVDCGVEAPGGIRSALMFSLAAMGGVAELDTLVRTIGKQPLLFLDIVTETPLLATIACQWPYWRIEVESKMYDIFGPARALARIPEEIYDRLGYEDDFDMCVALLYASEIPGEDLADFLARACNVDPEGLTILVARDGSLASIVERSSRVLLYSLRDLLRLDGIDVISAHASVPIVPRSPEDAIFYAGSCFLHVRTDADLDLGDIASKLVSRSRREYGSPILSMPRERAEEILLPSSVMLFDDSRSEMASAGYQDLDRILNLI